MFKVVFKQTSLPNYQIGDKFEEIEGNFHFRPILNTSEKTTKLLQLTTSLAHISTLLERHSEQLFLPPERGPVVVIHSIPIRLTPNEFLHSIPENIEKGREVERGRGKNRILNTKENQLINQKLWVELPLCPSCFERLDQEVVNIPYNWNVEKQFSKRGKWEGNRCEVCEHCKEFSKEHTEFKKFLTINCEYCSSKNDLWVCLICGTIGCGRHNGGHAYQHFQQTSHYFTMELSTQRIWDYYTETYVHRLITGPDCDILIEFPHKKAQGKKNYQSVEEKEEFYSAIIQSKCESLANEYEYMISSQLEEQRTFFEDHIMTIKEKILKKQKIERQRIEKKFNLVKNEERRFNNEMKSLQNNRTENLTLNQELCKKQKNLVLIKEEFETKLQNKVLEQQREIQDLKEQIRDLNFFLKSQIAIQESQIKDEIKTGKIIISKNQKKRSRNRRNRRNRRKN
ncbi:brca1-associated protein [Anaeramoeba flamelloides]|uniref:Brca1-associated protein n=1 Tax=Anaeramoeba flamelloides TaxID=1746091 RepID=A0AAV7YBB7_9EUKA|nr:brca1-associated protein [Anaeramoeba flamelloides]